MWEDAIHGDGEACGCVAMTPSRPFSSCFLAIARGMAAARMRATRTAWHGRVSADHRSLDPMHDVSHFEQLEHPAHRRRSVGRSLIDMYVVRVETTARSSTRASSTCSVSVAKVYEDHLDDQGTGVQEALIRSRGRSGLRRTSATFERARARDLRLRAHDGQDRPVERAAERRRTRRCRACRATRTKRAATSRSRSACSCAKWYGTGARSSPTTHCPYYQQSPGASIPTNYVHLMISDGGASTEKTQSVGCARADARPDGRDRAGSTARARQIQA